MNLSHRIFAKKMTNFVAIFGVTTAVVSFSPTAFSASKQIQTSPATISQFPPTGPDTTPAERRPSRVGELDRLYVTEAAQGGMAEVEMARLALQRSRNNEIRQYAQHMIREHTPVNQQLMQLANRKRITAPTTIGPKYQAAIARLSQFSGRDFDQAYKEEAGINLHLEYLVVQRRQSELGQDTDLRAFASKNIPVAMRHLQMGQRLLTQPTPR
jgi:putative membrane protein